MVGAAGLAGLIGAGGNPEGIPAGIGGLFGGGPSGAFSGGMLGAITGAGAIALAARSPGFRQHLGSGLATALRSAPVQQLGRAALSLPRSLPGSSARMSAAHQLLKFGRKPHSDAMAFLHDYLSYKSLRRVAMGAVGGGMVGGLVGGPLGAVHRAYTAGAEA